MLKEKSLIENESQFKQFMSNYIESNDVDGFFSIFLQQYTQESRLKAIQFAEQFLIKCSDYCKENGLKEESEALDKIFERKFSDDKAILVIYEFSLLIIFYFTHIDKNNILTIPKQLKNVRNDFAHLLGKLLSKACLQLAESIDNDTLTDDHIFLKYGFKINLKALSPILKDFASQISLEILEDFQKLIYFTTYKKTKGIRAIERFIRIFGENN